MKTVLRLAVFGLILIGYSCKEETPTAIFYEGGIQEKLPHDYMFMQRAYPTGQIKPGAQRLAARWKNEQLKDVSRSQSILWEFAGPLNIGGRLTDIEIVESVSNAVYIGAASGGIFKSTDQGNTWLPIFDEQPMLAIGDIEVSKSDTDVIAVGTGEVNAGGGSLAYDGDGVYVSSDAGMTWSNMGLQEVGSIGKVIIHPTNTDIMWVGAMGPLFRNDANRGVYKTTDGGETWIKTLFIAANTGVVDMSIHPANPNILYAAAWQRERSPEDRTYGGENSNIYRSTDGGETWSILSNGLPSAAQDKGRISIDIAPSNPDVLYASYADAIGSIQGIYKTEDGGETWETKNSSQLTNVGFHWWFGGLFINPLDEDEVYHVGFTVQKTTNGADSWQDTFNGVHVDQHALAFDPQDPTTVFLGNDGGLYKSGNSGDNSILDVTLPITQFYRMYVDPSNPDKIYAGAQDNSTMRTTTAGLSDWSIITGGDGFQPLVDKDNTNVIYTLSQRGNLLRSTDDAVSFQSVLSGIPNSDRKNWDTPIAFDPQDNNVLYYGSQRVYRSLDMAGNWMAISADLTNGDGGGVNAFGTITSIDISPLDSNLIYAGTDDGNVWHSLDGGDTWEIISGALPDRWVTRVKASPVEIDEVFVTFSGYRYGDDEGNVFKSTDNGLNWDDLTANIPDIPVSDIEVDPFNNLFLATDIGVLSSNNGGNTWLPFGENVPSVIVTDLHYDENSGFLYAATYGRSMYKVDISDNVLALPESTLAQTQLTIYPNPAQDAVSISFDGEPVSGTVCIYNQLGQLVTQPRSLKSEKTLAISDLADGMYIVQVKMDGRTLSRKLIKQ